MSDFNPQTAFNALSENAAELFKHMAGNAEPQDPTEPEGAYERGSGGRYPNLRGRTNQEIGAVAHAEGVGSHLIRHLIQRLEETGGL